MRSFTILVSLAVLGFVHSVFAQNTRNPFGVNSKLETSKQSDISKLQALNSLTLLEKHKVNPQHLNSLFDNVLSSYIVEYKTSADVSDLKKSSMTGGPDAIINALTTKKIEYQQTKRNVRNSSSSLEFEELRDFDYLPMNHVQVYSRASLLKLIKNTNVKAIFENKPHKRFLTESLPLIKQPNAALAGFRGAGTTVAVLDSGLNYTLPAFGNCTSAGLPISTCRVPVAFDTAPNDALLDDDGHGTNVAGIIASVAPDSKIIAIDVFSGSSAYTSDIIAGINWSISNQLNYNIVAINLSLGADVKYTTECTASWATAPFANARAVGILPIVASGNSGWTDGLPEPACAPGAVRVGAVYDSNIGAVSWSGVGCTDTVTAADKVACFSNSSNNLTVLAPGSSITAAGITQNGTSQATPHVAGAVAVLRASNAAPTDSLTQTISRMTSTGVTVVDSRTGQFKPRLDLQSAVNSIFPVQPPTTPSVTAAKIIPFLEILLLSDD